MVVKPAKTMDLTMEMVKKSRLFQQNGGENPQLATINGWIWKTSRWSDQVWYETLHSTFMKWPCPSKLPGCVYWHCLCQLCQSFLCLSQNGFRAMVTCSFWLPVLWVFTIHHILFPPLSIPYSVSTSFYTAFSKGIHQHNGSSNSEPISDWRMGKSIWKFTCVTLNGVTVVQRSTFFYEA